MQQLFIVVTYMLHLQRLQAKNFVFIIQNSQFGFKLYIIDNDECRNLIYMYNIDYNVYNILIASKKKKFSRTQTDRVKSVENNYKFKRIYIYRVAFFLCLSFYRQIYLSFPNIY